MTTSDPHPIEGALAALGEFLDALAAERPLPAGGAAAAVSVALGASLGVMAARLCGSPDAEARLLGVQRDAVALAAEDCYAYEAVLAARRRKPRDDDEVRSAWARATRAPIAVADAAASVLSELDGLREVLRPSLSCDVGAARKLATAGAAASLANARENLSAIRKPDARTAFEARIETLASRLDATDGR